MYNQVEVRQRIMQALEEVIAQHGTDGVSVGIIAQKANVTKGLIYRYFGGVEGLLDHYVRHSKAFPHFTIDYLERLRLVQADEAAHIWSGQMIQFFRQLRSSKATREVIKSSIVSDDSLAQTINQTQHKELIHLAQHLSLLGETGNQAALAILLGGMYYLTLMAHNDQPIMDIDLRSEAGWQQVEESIKIISNRLNKPVASAQSTHRIPPMSSSQAA